MYRHCRNLFKVLVRWLKIDGAIPNALMQDRITLKVFISNWICSFYLCGLTSTENKFSEHQTPMLLKLVCLVFQSNNKFMNIWLWYNWILLLDIEKVLLYPQIVGHNQWNIWEQTSTLIFIVNLISVDSDYSTDDLGVVHCQNSTLVRRQYWVSEWDSSQIVDRTHKPKSNKTDNRKHNHLNKCKYGNFVHWTHSF